MIAAGVSEVDITPDGEVWLDGMIRSHRSTGIHDALHARALCLSPGGEPGDSCVLVTLDLAGISVEDALAVREGAQRATGIPRDRIILAASHTHSGPATIGYFNPKETGYVKMIVSRLVALIQSAAAALEPAAAGCASGAEGTISHYRRLKARDGHVVMNWEAYPASEILGPLGQVDPELGVLRVDASGGDRRSLCVAFNHAGHPNVLSGENYLISADYPGLASQLISEKLGCPALFLNGAQGTMDIDGLKDRDWEGRQRIGTALADAAVKVAAALPVTADVRLRCGSVRYSVPSRKISPAEYVWASGILAQTGGKLQPLADGVGDDFKASLLHALREREAADNSIEHVCLALDDSAFISFPGELFTEIGMEIKRLSPFARTYIIGLANGSIGYVPTREAVAQGGYEVETRRLDDSAADRIVEHSLSLLRDVHAQ
jgi:neutral ceramidase